MRFAIPVFASLILCAAVPSFSRSIAPSFDCAKSDSDAENAICADDGLAELDLELSRVYRLAQKGPGMTSDRVKELQQSQRDWVRDRRECWKASIGLDTCVANTYAFRIHALREGYAGARSDDRAGISRGPVALRCHGMDALISAVFLNGTRSLVSLQWRDGGMVLPRVPSGSGEKYETDIWDGGTALLWVHGKEATFSEPGGAERTCVVEEVG